MKSNCVPCFSGSWRVFFHYLLFLRTHIIKFYHRNTGIYLPPCGDVPLPSVLLFLWFMKLYSQLRGVNICIFYFVILYCITNIFFNRVKSCKSCISERVKSYWSSLPTLVKASSSVDMFKANLENYKKECHLISECNFWDFLGLYWTELRVHLILTVKRNIILILLTTTVLPKNRTLVFMDFRPLLMLWPTYNIFDSGTIIFVQLVK